MPGVTTTSLALAAALAACLLAAPPAGAVPGIAGQASSCRNAGVRPDDMSAAAARRTTLCLLNAERRGRRLPGLRHNRRLARAALRHARDMAARDYFAHESPDGRDFVDRILDTSYVRLDDPGWVLGENLGWGSGELSTPRAMVRSWMHSPGHRDNILERRFREVGIAVIRGAPAGGVRHGATYATEFGRRRRR